MKFEYTKTIDESGWKALSCAATERWDNIILGEQKEQLLDTLLHQPTHITRAAEFFLLSEMAAESGKLWANGKVLRVYFFGGQDERTARVLEIASAWSLHGNITFEVTNNRNESDLRVSFNPTGSWSYIGTDAIAISKNNATINFGWLDTTLPDLEFRQVVLHEFGHALGLVHEHQSLIANIDWNKEYVYNAFQVSYNWSKEMVDHNIFKEFERSSIRHSTLDKLSIMGYHVPPEFTKNNQEFSLNYELSDMDKEYFGSLYPFQIHS